MWGQGCSCRRASARRPVIAGLLVTLLIAIGSLGCKGTQSRVTVQNEEPAAAGPRAMNVRMNDATAGDQLLSGFYAVENNMWRWTAGKFSVLLRTPAAAPNGATLSLSLSVPEVTIKKLKNIRLTASIAGTELKSEDYDTPGPYVFNADVPASLLHGESVEVDFAVNKTMRPDGDKRELGVIANSVAISPK